MAYRLIIDHDTLIDALEEKLHNVYENIKEGDKITSLSLQGWNTIEIVIGGRDGEYEGRTHTYAVGQRRRGATL